HSVAQTRHDAQSRGHQGRPEPPHRRVVSRPTAAREISDRKREHEDRDDRTPDVDTAAERGRQHAPTEQLDRHNEEARPAGDEVGENGVHKRYFFSGSTGWPLAVTILNSSRASPMARGASPRAQIETAMLRS